MTKSVVMGRRYDGGHSPLGGRVRLGEGPSMASGILLGNDRDIAILPNGVETTVKELRNTLGDLGYTPDEFKGLPATLQNDITRKIEKAIRRALRGKIGTLEGLRERELHKAARTEMHKTLVPWSRGELKLERPQASSLHHLLRYDAECAEDTLRTIMHEADVQSFIVENDWGRLVPTSVTGEWRLPFARICWEFRINGVRVLAFTDAGDLERPRMFTVYGRDKIWVSDDYVYNLTQDGFHGRPHDMTLNSGEFRRVMALVYANIRASCIMLDARVARGEEVAPNDALVKRAQREGTPAPRRHHVVRLLRPNAVRSRNDARRGDGSSGVRQGGHWRPGRWLHYDNPDSGSEKYVNDGGFWVSKSWQRWHFAGDMNNLVEKEYRL